MTGLQHQDIDERGALVEQLLADICRARGLTRKALAERLGMTPRSYRNWMDRAPDLRADEVGRLVDALEMGSGDRADLYRLCGLLPPPSLSSEERRTPGTAVSREVSDEGHESVSRGADRYDKARAARARLAADFVQAWEEEDPAPSRTEFARRSGVSTYHLNRALREWREGREDRKAVLQAMLGRHTGWQAEARAGRERLATDYVRALEEEDPAPTQAEFARRAGVSVDTLARALREWRKGRGGGGAAFQAVRRRPVPVSRSTCRP